MVEGFQRVDLKLDDVADKIHQEGAQTRAEISQVIRQTMGISGKLLDLLPSHIHNVVNFVYQKSVSVMPPTPGLIPTQGAWNA